MVWLYVFLVVSGVLNTVQAGSSSTLQKVSHHSIFPVGKDGGKKLRSDKPLSWQTLEQTIDSMPMRQDEAKTR